MNAKVTKVAEADGTAIKPVDVKGTTPEDRKAAADAAAQAAKPPAKKKAGPPNNDAEIRKVVKAGGKVGPLLEGPQVSLHEANLQARARDRKNYDATEAIVEMTSEAIRASGGRVRTARIRKNLRAPVGD